MLFGPGHGRGDAYRLTDALDGRDALFIRRYFSLSWENLKMACARNTSKWRARLYLFYSPHTHTTYTNTMRYFFFAFAAVHLINASIY